MWQNCLNFSLLLMYSTKCHVSLKDVDKSIQPKCLTQSYYEAFKYRNTTYMPSNSYNKIKIKVMLHI